MALTSVILQHRGNNKAYEGTAAPSLSTELGPYNVGDIVWNTVPAGAPAPILARMRCRPRGVQPDPSISPGPLAAVDTG